MTSPRLVSANRNPALPDGVPRYAYLFGAQSERRLASCTGPFSPQPLPTTDPFLYGDSCLCPGRHPSWGLCDVTGPSRPSYLHILIHRRDLRWIRFVWQGRAGQGRAGQSVSVLGAPLRPFLGPLGFHQSPGSFTAGRGACESTCIWTTGGLTGPVSYPRPSASTAGRSSGVRHQRCQVGGYPISDVLLSRYKFQYEGASGPVSRVGLAVRR